jgi:UDP-N-acetylglucosamine 2-epimerase (non-hydrolysing)
MAAFHHKIPEAHVEAGLRSGRSDSPFPEEMNRRLITKLATWHFAATAYNRETLLREGVSDDFIFLTGNPVVDALHGVLASTRCSEPIRRVLDATAGRKLIVLTTHRRESFGGVMVENLRVLRNFVDRCPDVALVFPVHPNPCVLQPAKQLLSGVDRIYLVPPLDYGDFVFLLAHSWLIVSDSGGIQEEAPSLGKPVLVLRENTERPEAIQSGVARLVGGRPETLGAMLDEVYRDGAWAERVRSTENPFGKGDAGKRIANIIAALLNASFQTSLFARAS